MSQNRSAFESIPGRDAIFEYIPKIWPAKTYVEYQGLIYKSLIQTAPTFVTSEWELINDLREVRVANIAERNFLTGSTLSGTSLSGSTIRVPILDNTNVLVLNAIADPQVGTADFARYNYNLTNASWLLLQIGTGSTSGTTITDYTLLSNKPPIISGVTANAGAGLTGGGVTNGSVPPNRATFTFAHADTSTQANIDSTGYTYVQKLRFDDFGHVTGATNSTWAHPDTSSQATVNNTGTTYIQSLQLDADGHLIGISSSTWVHPNTSSQGDEVNVGQAFIQSIYLDSDGHVIGISTGTAAGGGGGGTYSVKVNGNSGGVLTVASGGTITISGGTNINTTRTGNAANPGIRVDVIPAGTSGQLQYNGGAGLAASSNLVWSGASNTLRAANIVIGFAPTTGSTADQFLVRNLTTGAIQRLNLGTIARAISGGANNNIQYKTVNGFGGASDFYYDPAAGAVTLGGRNAGATGTTSFSVGTGNVVSGNRSVAIGSQNIVSGVDSLANGALNSATGSGSHAEGQQTSATTFYAHSEGFRTIASGQGSHAQGTLTKASGTYSHAAGSGVATKEIIADGTDSFNHSTNNNLQIVGHGANAASSAILGGLNHNIELGNSRAVIVGGNAIKLTGTSYIDHVAVPNFAIMTQPALGIAADDVLVRSATTGRIRRVTQASLSGGGGGTPAGANTQVQYNNGGAFGASANFTFDAGTSTLLATNVTVNTALGITTVPASGTSAQILVRNSVSGIVQRIGVNAIAALPLNAIQFRNAAGFGGDANWVFDPTAEAVTLGTRTGATSGLYSFTQGLNLRATALYSSAFGIQTKADGQNSMAIGQLTTATGTSSFASGVLTRAWGSSSHAEGSQTFSNANASHSEGQSTNATGNYSHAEGFGGTASGVASHAEGQSTIASNSSAHAEGQSTVASGQQSHAEGNATFASGATSHSQNQYTRAVGVNSHAAGNGFVNRPVYAIGVGAFAHTNNSNVQTAGHGASADHSAILGGLNHNIASGNTRAAIIGGNAIKLTGTTYIDHVAVPNLAIFSTPSNAALSDDYLTWNSTTKKVGKAASPVASNYSNIVYVSKLGNDGTGVVNNASKPFLTINAAHNAAAAIGGKSSVNKYLVYVLPGDYIWTTALNPVVISNFIDFYFSKGASITINAQVGFTSIDSGIYGEGYFICGTASIIMFNFTTTAQPTTFEAFRFSPNAAAIGINCNTAEINIDIKYIETGTHFLAQAGGTVYLNFKRLSVGTLGVQLNANSTHYMSGDKATTNGGTIIHNLGAASNAYISVTEMSNTAALGGNIIAVSSTSKTKLSKTKLLNTPAGSLYTPIYYGQNTATVYLDGVVIVMNAGAAFSVYGAPVSGNRLICYGNAYSNKPVDVTRIVTPLGVVTVDAVNVDF